MKFFFMGLRKELTDLYHSISNYDYTLLKTIRDVILCPQVVVEAEKGRYSTPMRVAVTVFTTSFVIMYFMDPSWVDSYDEMAFWRFPIEVQNFQRIQASIQQNYSALVNATLWIPIYFGLLRILFWGKKSWNYFYKLAMYQSPIFWGLQVVIALISELTVGFDWLVGLGILVLLIHQFLVLKLQVWYASLLKGVIAVIATLCMLLYLNPFYFTLVQNLIGSEERVFELPSSDNEVIELTEVQEFFYGFIQGFELTSERSGYFHTEYTVGYISESEIVWTQELEHGYSTMLLTNHSQLLLIETNATNTKTEALLFDQKEGEELGKVYLEERGALLNANIIASSDSTITLFMRQEKAYVATLTRQDEEWEVQKKDIGAEHETLFDLVPLSNTLYAASYVEVPESHISKMEVGILNSELDVIWIESVYQKSTPYNPHNYLQVISDTISNELIVHYVLANDSLMESKLHSFDTQSGELKVQSRFSIPANAAEFSLKGIDSEHVYLVGEVHRNYSRWFGDPLYHIGAIAVIDRQEGSLSSLTFFGPTTTNAHSDVEDIYIQDDRITFFSNDFSASNNLTVNKDYYRFKTILKEQLLK